MARFIFIILLSSPWFNLKTQNVPFQLDINEQKLLGSDRSNNLIAGNGLFPESLDLDICFVNINFQNAKLSSRNDSLIRLYDELIKNISTEYLGFKSKCFLDFFVESDSSSFSRRYSHFEIEYSPFCENPAAYNQPELMRIIKFNGNKFKYANLHNTTYPFSIILSFQTNSDISELISYLVRSRLLYGSKFLVGVGDIDESISHLNIKSINDLEFILEFLNRHYARSQKHLEIDDAKNSWDSKTPFITLSQTQLQGNSLTSFPTYYTRAILRQYVLGMDLPIFNNKYFNVGVSYNNCSNFESKPIASYTIFDENENRANYLGLKSTFSYSEIGVLIGLPLVNKKFHDYPFNIFSNAQIASYLIRNGEVDIFASEYKQIFTNGIIHDNGILHYSLPVRWNGFNSSSSFQINAGCTYTLSEIPINISLSIGKLFYTWKELSYSSEDLLVNLYLDKILQSNTSKGNNIEITISYKVL